MKPKPIAIVFLMTIFAMLSAQQGQKNQADQLSNKFKTWNDALPEDRVYVQCDKPFYAPGETIWFSAFVRDGQSFRPSLKSDIVHVELLNPKGSVEKQAALICKNGVAPGDFTLGDELPGGMYTIKAYTNWQKNDPDPAFFVKEIQVQAVVLPRLKMKLDFEKKSYGSGDKVRANLSLETNENKPLAGHALNFSVALAGAQILEQPTKSDNAGKVAIDFTLPAKLTSADGLLNVLLDFDGQTESISRSIPIVLNKVSITFFPEGGDLVSGLASAVAFKAVNEFGKGADIEGYVTDNKKNKMATFSSFHLGMGAFQFTPKEGVKYSAHVTKPSGINDVFEIPDAMPQGYVLTVKSVVRSQLQMSIGSTRNEKLRIFLHIRGKEYFSKVMDAKKGANDLIIDCSAMPAGVAQITLFDSKEIERAERLVFVNKFKRAIVTVKTDKERYLPRDKVKMTITASDETGMRMPGNFALAVTDDQLLSFADDKSSTILSHMLAEADVKGAVEEPRFYFDAKEEKADQALDYLLLTHGWRRFAWKQVQESEPPSAASFEAEKTIIAGVVMDGQTSKGAPDVDVQIPELKIKTTTDSSGRFSFKNVELYEPKTIEAKKGDQQTQTSVNRYTSTLQLWLYARRAPTLFLEENAEVMEKKIGRAQNMKQLLKAKAFVRPAEAMAPAAPPPPAQAAIPQPAPKAAQKPQMAQPVQAQKKEVADLKIRGKKRADMPAHGMAFAERDIAPEPPAPQEAQPMGYYRAREYAMPDYKDLRQPFVRNDFRSTIFWKGDVELKNNGTAAIEFYANDAITSFRAITEGFITDGSIGRAEHVFYSQMPFAMSVKIPPVLLTGDTAELALLIKNTASSAVKGFLALTIPPGLKLLKNIETNWTVDAGKSHIVPIKLLALSRNDSAMLGISFTGNGLSDAITTPIKISPQGFPVDLSFSGNELTSEHHVKIVNCVQHSISASVRAYPSVVSDLLAGIESILQEPSGCFEQTSMTSYPNALVLSYLKAIDKPDPQIKDKAEALLEKGYKRLLTFESKEKGYEWFGQNPGHEALTAYGLMQFSDMNRVGAAVDKAMLDRTTNWLMTRRDNKGGFLRNPQALDSYGGADQNITDAYIVYALAEAGRRDIQKELDASVAHAKGSNDPYVIGLVANALYCFENFKQGDELLALIKGKQAADGSWCGTRHSITRSEGISLKLETTSLICLALMKSKNPDVNALIAGIKFIIGSRSGSGGFGATQSTIMSLKALTAYAQFARKTDSPGTIIVAVNNQDVAKKSYGAGERGAITIDSLDRFIPEGEHTVTVRFEGTKNALPHSLSVTYNTWKPVSAEACKLSLETSAAASEVKVGQTLRISTALKNKTQEGLPMTVAILGLPAGLSPQPWQLKELMEKKIVDFYEVSGSSVVFYYRQMKPGEVRSIQLDCKAEVPGFYTAPASRAYLYYTNEYKVWTSIKPVTVKN
jgi:alpha-2-macroglobulin-like protein